MQVVRGQPVSPCLLNHTRQKLLGHIRLQQPVAVLTEGSGVPNHEEAPRLYKPVVPLARQPVVVDVRYAAQSFELAPRITLGWRPPRAKRARFRPAPRCMPHKARLLSRRSAFATVSLSGFLRVLSLTSSSSALDLENRTLLQQLALVNSAPPVVVLDPVRRTLRREQAVLERNKENLCL
jgi:hypothetical protein